MASLRRVALAVVVILALLLVRQRPCRAADAPETILVIVAHPDDETMVAKTLKRALQRGAQVKYLYLTEGEGGIRVETTRRFGVPVAKHDDQGLVKRTPVTAADRDALAGERKEEIKTYHGRFGERGPVLEMLHGNPDRWHGGARALDHVIGPAAPGHQPDWQVDETVDVIANKIREENPDHVITLSDNDKTHPGHQAAYHLTERAVQRVRAAGSRVPGVFRIVEDGWYDASTFKDMTENGQVVSSHLGAVDRVWKRMTTRAYASQPAGHMTHHNHELKSIPHEERLVAAESTSQEAVQRFASLVGTKPTLLQRARFTVRAIEGTVRPASRPRMSVRPVLPSRALVHSGG